MGTLQSLQSNPTRTLRLDTTGLQQLDNDLTPRQGLELEELAQWHAAANKFVLIKSCFCSEKKSSKDGKGRTPNSAEPRARVLAERLAARAWNERFATHDVTSWEQVMAEMDKNMAATLWKTSEFVPKSSSEFIVCKFFSALSTGHLTSKFFLNNI